MINLQEFTTLEQAQAYSEITYRVLSTDEVSVILSLPNIGLYDYFLDATIGLRHLISTLLQKNSNFVFANNEEEGVTNQFLFSVLESQEGDADIKTKLAILKSTLIGAANVEKFPYINKTQTDLDAAKLALSPENLTVIDKRWVTGTKLNITLHADLYEPANCVVFYSDDFLVNENLGRSKRLHKAGAYQIDLSRLKPANITWQLHVNFNINANVTVEIV